MFCLMEQVSHQLSMHRGTITSLTHRDFRATRDLDLTWYDCSSALKQALNIYFT